MPDRRGLTLIEKPDGSCIFLEDGEPCGCRINPVKPKQCDGFPSRWSFPGMGGGVRRRAGDADKRAEK